MTTEKRKKNEETLAHVISIRVRVTEHNIRYNRKAYYELQLDPDFLRHVKHEDAGQIILDEMHVYHTALQKLPKPPTVGDQ